MNDPSYVRRSGISRPTVGSRPRDRIRDSSSKPRNFARLKGNPANATAERQHTCGDSEDHSIEWLADPLVVVHYKGSESFQSRSVHRQAMNGRNILHSQQGRCALQGRLGDERPPMVEPWLPSTTRLSFPPSFASSTVANRAATARANRPSVSLREEHLWHRTAAKSGPRPTSQDIPSRMHRPQPRCKTR